MCLAGRVLGLGMRRLRPTLRLRWRWSCWWLNSGRELRWIPMCGKLLGRGEKFLAGLKGNRGS